MVTPSPGRRIFMSRASSMEFATRHRAMFWKTLGNVPGHRERLTHQHLCAAAPGRNQPDGRLDEAGKGIHMRLDGIAVQQQLAAAAQRLAGECRYDREWSIFQPLHGMLSVLDRCVDLSPVRRVGCAASRNNLRSAPAENVSLSLPITSPLNFPSVPSWMASLMIFTTSGVITLSIVVNSRQAIPSPMSQRDASSLQASGAGVRRLRSSSVR